MVHYQEENDKILSEWRKKAEENANSNDIHFVNDGLLFCGEVIRKGDDITGYYYERQRGNEDELYEFMTPKLMLLTKDFNDDDGDTSDIRIETFRKNFTTTEKPETSGLRFHQNILAHVWGLTHYITKLKRCPKWEDDEKNYWSWKQAREFYESNPIVRINVKKQAGGNSIKNSELTHYLYNKDYRPLLIKQIKLFNPDIIVCYGKPIFQFVIDKSNHIIEDVEYDYNDPWAYYSNESQKVIINSYHPSNRNLSRERNYLGIMDGFEKIMNEHEDIANKWF